MAEGRQSFPWRGYGVVLIAIVLFALAPLVVSSLAELIAQANGCTLFSQGTRGVCIVWGNDWGEWLYAMFVLGWFLYATIPLGFGALIVFAVILIIHRLAFARSQQSEQA